MIEKLDKLHTKIEVPAGYGMAAATASVPLWVDQITTYGELLLLLLSIIIAFATAVIQVRKAIRKDKLKADK